MRRWLALIIGTTVVALSGTALALVGSTEGGDAETTIETTPETTTETTTAVEETADKPVDFEPIADWTLPEDKLPPREQVETEPADEIPPEIAILHPEDGQVFERREVVFEGEAEPGARVFAGDHEAEVSDNGAWRIVLLLEKGENTVTIKAVDASENVGSDTVTVVYRAPEPKPEQPKEEEPKEEQRKEEEPKEEQPAEWEFKAHQLYGECRETPPFDIFHGTGKPGSLIHVESEYGGGTAEIGEKGGWEIKVIFESAPAGEVFAVHVADEFGNHKVFEFVHTG